MAQAVKQGNVNVRVATRVQSGFRPAVKNNLPVLNSGVDVPGPVKTDTAWRGFCFAVIPSMLFWVGIYLTFK